LDFIDRCLVRLADATTRAALFDQASLEQLASAAYDTDDMLIQGPFQALFDEFNVGIAPKALGTIEGSWRTIGAPDFTEVRLHTSGIGAAPLTPRIDCLWRGSIVVRSVPLDSQITSVETQWPDVETSRRGDHRVARVLAGRPGCPGAGTPFSICSARSGHSGAA
jgi:hypothetical protein